MVCTQTDAVMATERVLNSTVERVLSLVWPTDAAEPATAKVQRAAARYLITIPGFSSNGGALSQHVYKSLGVRKIRGSGKFLDVLRQQPSLFRCELRPDGVTTTVTLQAASLLQRAASREQQQLSTALPAAQQPQQPQNAQRVDPGSSQAGFGAAAASSSGSYQHTSGHQGTHQGAACSSTTNTPAAAAQPAVLALARQSAATGRVDSGRVCNRTGRDGSWRGVSSWCGPAAAAAPPVCCQAGCPRLGVCTGAAGITTAAAAQPDAASDRQFSPFCRPDACFDQLALLQLFVPAVCGYDSRIYLGEVPQEPEAAAALMRQLRHLLEDVDVIKVMPDSRQDSVVLQRQFGIILRGVLDTQLLAGCAALAGSVGKSSSGHSSSGEGSSSAGSSSSSSSSSSSAAGGPYLGRIGLGKLYDLFGCPPPQQGRPWSRLHVQGL